MKEPKEVIILTHSSKFHTDDVFAVATLILLLEKEHKIKIIRSREPSFLATADYVVDKGGIDDQKTNRFDHHQEGGAGGRKNAVPYSSFGLVWKKFGKNLCGSQEVADKVDKELVQPIDLYDNGIKYLETNIKNIHPFDINKLIDAFRPTWKENNDIDDVFMEVVLYSKTLLLKEIKHIKDEHEAVGLVINAYNNSPDKKVIELDERWPWGETLVQFPEPIFVIYKKRVDNDWSIKTIRDDIFSYNARKDLPKAWAGKRDEELEKVTGVPGSVFCHNGRFIAVAKTKEAILKLAQIALND